MVTNSDSSDNSYKSAHSSITVVPSDGSVESTKTITEGSTTLLDSTKNVPAKPHVKKHGAKSNTIKSVGKGNKTFGLKKGKSVGNIPTDISKFMIAAEQKKSIPVGKVDNSMDKSLSNCNALPEGTHIDSNKKFQSDHNPVVVYLPGLFDGTKSAYVITYNEKGNSGICIEKNDFLTQLPLIQTVDMVFIGIQEGDINKVFVNNLIKNMGMVFSEEASRLYNPPKNMEKTVPYFTSPNNMVLTNIKGRRNVLPSKDWILTTNTYESTGKECLKNLKGACLVNGCYVLLRTGSGLIIEDSGKDIIKKGNVLNTTKHCAWAVVKQESNGIKHVFASCHLEYSGNYDPDKTDLLGYNKRKEQLTGYITMLYKKYNSVSRFIFCGDTNMRMLSSANYIYASKTKYILDQMLFYLMQCENSENKLNSIAAIENYLTINNFDSFESNSEGKYVLNTKFWTCVKCDIALGRKMLLYRIGNGNPFCSYLTGNVKNNKRPECKDITNLLLGSDILQKFNAVDMYVKNNKADDKFAGYCMNPSFVAGDNLFRAYDFSYKDLTTNCMMNTIWDVYNYKPTAIFTLDGPNRTFDYAKRVKSGYILAPAIVDRVFMFEPHKLHVIIDTAKVGFVNY